MSKTPSSCAFKIGFLSALEIVSLREPSETRRFPFGRFDLFSIGGQSVGLATYEPGWRWSEHLGQSIGAKFCEVAHLGLVLSGRAIVQMADGSDALLESDNLFAIAPGHDSWVVGGEQYVSLHFLGSDAYAT